MIQSTERAYRLKAGSARRRKVRCFPIRTQSGARPQADAFSTLACAPRTDE